MFGKRFCVILLAAGVLQLSANQDGNKDCHAVSTADEPCENRINDEANPKMKRHLTREHIIEDTKNEAGLTIKFLCQEATRTIVHFHSNKTIMGIDKWNRFALRIYMVEGETRLLNSYEEVYSDPGVTFVKVTELKPNTTYAFGVCLKTHEDSAPVEIITNDTYTTSAADYSSLTSVTHSQVSPLVSLNGKEVRTNFTWIPVREQVCSYEILIITQNATVGEHPEHYFPNVNDFFVVEIPNLCYDCRISIGVYPANPITEGKKTWISFESPRCVDFHNWNYSICAPLKLEDVELKLSGCQLDIQWNHTGHIPPKYQIIVTPSDPNRDYAAINDTISGQFPKYRLNTHFLGEFMTIKLRALSPAGAGPFWSKGIENHCTPQEAATEPIRPPVVFHKTDYRKTTLATESPSIETDSRIPFYHALLVAIVVAIIIGLIILIGFRAYYIFYEVDYNPLIGNQNMELRRPTCTRNLSDINLDASCSVAELASSAQDGDSEFELSHDSAIRVETVTEGARNVMRKGFYFRRP